MVSRTALIALGLIAVLFAAASLWVLAGTFTPSPYADAWDWLGSLVAYRRGGDLIDYLLEPHHGHRIVWTRALMLIDHQWAGGLTLAFLVSSLALLAALSWVLIRRLRAEDGWTWPYAALLVLALIWSAPNLADAALAINASYVQAAVLSALALAAFDRADLGRTLVAIALAAAACLANAAALAVWPALALAAWQARDLRGLTLAAVVAAPTVAILLLGQVDAAAISAPDPTAVDPGAIVTYAVAYLGLPYTRLSPVLGLAAGLAMALAGAGLVLASLGARSPLVRLAGRLALFSLGTAVLAAIGRAIIDSGDVPVRYTMLLAPLHAAIVLALAAWASTADAGARTRIAAGAVVCALALTAQQLLIGRALIDAAERNRALIAAFEAGRRDVALVPTVHWDLDRASRIREDAIAAGLLR